MVEYKKVPKFTDKQKLFIKLLVENRQKHKSERLTQAECYVAAGYSEKNPDQGATSAIRKPKMEKELNRLCPGFFDKANTLEKPPSELDASEAELKRWSTTSAQAAYNYATYMQKKTESGMIEDAVENVLLCPLLDEAKLDELMDATPQHIVVAADAGREISGDDESDVAEVPVNIEEKSDDGGDCE